jgi:hypothetical protein
MLPSAEPANRRPPAATGEVRAAVPAPADHRYAGSVGIWLFEKPLCSGSARYIGQEDED